MALTDQLFADHNANLLLQDVNCNGSESFLRDCEYSTLILPSCQPLEDAGVVCQGIYFDQKVVRLIYSEFYTKDLGTSVSDCVDGEMRLEGGDFYNRSKDGRIELCFNNAWGTVCNTFFSIRDAEVACNHLAGFQREGMYI